jgi:sarcosine oxidase, subunit gamma
MNTGNRLSPLHDAIAALNPRWTVVHGMLVPVEIETGAHGAPVQLSDASCLLRMGVKGSKAQAWLVSQGIGVPPAINSWTRTAEGTLVARLARSEFFLEDRANATTVTRLKGNLAPASGVSPVLRQEAALVLYGPNANDLLVQTCNVNFRAWKPEDRTVVMTSMVGVSVLVIWEPHQGLPRYRIWCDHTFAAYLWETLAGIARELGGGAVGLRSLMPEISA